MNAPNQGAAASTVLDRLVGLRADDSVLVISDPSADQGVLAAVTAAVADTKATCLGIQVPAVVELGDELPDPLSAALAMADVVILVVRWLPAWVATRGFWRAVHEYGTRVLVFDPPYGPALANGLTDGELADVVGNAEVLSRKVLGAEAVLIVDRFGNELRCGVDAGNRNASAEFPLAFGFSKFPTGLFTLGVLPGTYAGRIVWDAVEGHPMVDGDRIEVEVADGAVQRVTGQGTGMEHVAAKVAECPAFALVTEFGLGIDPRLPEEAFLREAWHEGANRSAGIVHFGLGSSKIAGPGGRKFHTHLVSRGASVLTLPDRVPLVMAGVIEP